LANNICDYWGIASVGAGLGGVIFQSISGVMIKNLSTHFDYTIAYNAVFLGYGLIALIGLAVVLFLTGPLVQNKELHDYVTDVSLK